MSFIRLRAAAPARLLTRHAFNRGFATTPGANKPSNTPYYLMGVGITSILGYAYMDGRFSPTKLQEKSPLDPENFVDFKLKKIIPYNHNTSTFVFELPNNEASLMPVASCLAVKTPLKDAKGNPIVRPYTPISQPDEKGVLTLLVKRYDNGNASKHIHSLKEGESLSFKGPFIKFKYEHNQFDEVALIGGGSGVTPLYQLLSHALANPANKTKFTLLFSNVTETDILMREEFDALKKKHPATFNPVFLLDKPPAGWTGPTGYISKDVVKQHVPPATMGEKVKVFVCGPPPQVAAIAGKKAGMKQGELGGILKEMGYTEDQVFKF